MSNENKGQISNEELDQLRIDLNHKYAKSGNEQIIADNDDLFLLMFKELQDQKRQLEETKKELLKNKGVHITDKNVAEAYYGGKVKFNLTLGGIIAGIVLGIAAIIGVGQQWFFHYELANGSRNMIQSTNYVEQRKDGTTKFLIFEETDIVKPGFWSIDVDPKTGKKLLYLTYEEDNPYHMDEVEQVQTKRAKQKNKK